MAVLIRQVNPRFVRFADEYGGDEGRTAYPEYAKASPLISIKDGEGLGPYPSYPPMHAGAHSAGLAVLAYFWPLVRVLSQAKAQAQQMAGTLCELFAVDLESGRAGTHSSNQGATKAEVLAFMHVFFDAFHDLRPNAFLLLYGASYMGNLHITWAELVGDRAWILAWLPRYSSASGDPATWSLKQVLDYAEPWRYGVPANRVAAVQVTDGTFGPLPHTMPGLNRNEDLSVLLVPLSDLLAGIKPPKPHKQFTHALDVEFHGGKEAEHKTRSIAKAYRFELRELRAAWRAAGLPARRRRVVTHGKTYRFSYQAVRWAEAIARSDWRAMRDTPGAPARSTKVELWDAVALRATRSGKTPGAKPRPLAVCTVTMMRARA